ncbi:CPBP family intramembrane glutamic endopeptidase [Archangium lansingense]|uniref:CPBP family intramembrane metalloprotease n=1 Tax=Archangium lansingense TaxID=2995310 RepID=A0ABT3ZWR8_9BACT|nr:CPBP family intramembrane glutamic endopeptidase [Archangium lansinium]MCY1073816.1 CPBP family intramembrane metalloprotease [Archangium lansinium]
MVLVSRGLYRWSQGADAPALGLAPSRGALWQHLLGLLLGFALTSWSLWLGLATGTMRVTDTLTRHFSPGALVLVVLVAFTSLTLNSLNEEACSRAVPLGLVRRSPLWARVLLPALVFSLLHLAVEPFRMEAFLHRTLAGAEFSVAYLLTRDIWFAAGLHTGQNAGVLLCTGRWYMGGLLVVEGEGWVGAWEEPAVLLLLTLAGLWVLYRREAPAAPATPAPLRPRVV